MSRKKKQKTEIPAEEPTTNRGITMIEVNRDGSIDVQSAGVLEIKSEGDLKEGPGPRTKPSPASGPEFRINKPGSLFHGLDIFEIRPSGSPGTSEVVLSGGRSMFLKDRFIEEKPKES